MRRHGGILLVVVGMLALVTGCSGDDDSASSGSPAADVEEADEAVAETPAVEAEEYAGDDFSTPPDPLPEGEHGTLLRYQPIEGRSRARRRHRRPAAARSVGR